MDNIKVMAGQRWRNNSGFECMVYNEVAGIVRFMDSRRQCGSEHFRENFTFIPQTDLEWLAVNCDEWCDYDTVFICKKGGDYAFIPCFLGHCYTRQQWQNKRYELGLDEKPHYTFEDGVWIA